MEFKLTVGFNPETLQRIDAFLKALNTNAPVKKESALEILDKEIAEKTQKVNTVTTTSLGEVSIMQGNGKAQVITLEDLRKLTKEKSDKSKETKVKVVALIKEFAGSVSDIPEDKYTEYHTKLIQL